MSDPSLFEIQVSVAPDLTATVSVISTTRQNTFMLRPTLRSILHDVNDKSVQPLLIGIAAGMKHLHDHAIAHMNLTDSSIIVEQNGTITITNLGKYRNFANGASKASEKQQKNSSDAKEDILHFGYIIEELFTKKPINETSQKSQRTKVPSAIPREYAELLLKCTSNKLSERPTFTEILNQLQGMNVNANFKSLIQKSIYRPPRGNDDVDLNKFKGVIPAFYACYDDKGDVDEQRTRALASYLLGIDGIVGLYVGGSSGEGIYHTVAERKKVLEWVVAVNNALASPKAIIAHVGCNNLIDSQELASHAEEQKVDAIASIPPIYFKLPAYSIQAYWCGIAAAAPNTPFIIYNIPQLAGVNLTKDILKYMLENCPTIIGVKNSSTPTQDIQMWREVAMDKYSEQVDDKFIVFNGPDEQLISGLIIGANGCIGGTYASMPKLFVEAYKAVMTEGSIDNNRAMNIQNDICRIIYKFGEAHGNLYSVMKEVIKLQKGIDCGDVRAPLPKHTDDDMAVIKEAKEMIDAAYQKYGLSFS